ncbi:MAG: SRPBCC domain-containing protein [Terriglobia bacterium]
MMFYPESFKVTTPTDREIVVDRDFNAPRDLVFDSFTKPELVRRWLLGPDGWTMPVCDIDLRVGGLYRYVWRNESTGQSMGMGGVFREVVFPEKLVASEKFDEAWYAGEAVDTTVFEDRGATTRIKITVLYESKEARDTATRSGMEQGMAAGYNRLEKVLAEGSAQDRQAKMGTMTGHLIDKSMMDKTMIDKNMIDKPWITETTAQSAAAIHLTIPRSAIRSAMGPALAELAAAVRTQGVEPTGPWFTHHLKMDPGQFDFEVCLPVPAPVKPTGRVVSRDLPAVRVARTIYHGPYEGLGAAWGEFTEWIVANGHVPGPDLYETYVVGHDTSSNPADWRTEFSKPIL